MGVEDATSPRFECQGFTGGRGPTVVFHDLDLRGAGRDRACAAGAERRRQVDAAAVAGRAAPGPLGEARVDGVALRNGNAVAASRAGVVLVPDNRSLFTTLTVEENLAVARQRGGPAPALVEVFPRWRSAGAWPPVPCPVGSSRCWPWPGPHPAAQGPARGRDEHGPGAPGGRGAVRHRAQDRPGAWCRHRPGRAARQAGARGGRRGRGVNDAIVLQEPAQELGRIPRRSKRLPR